jgi:hypothetical protein
VTSPSAETRLIDLVPPTWFKDTKQSSVWIRGYWARPVLPKDLPQDQVEVTLANAIAVLSQASISYWFVGRPDIEPTDTRDVRLRTPRQYAFVTSPPGVYLTMMVPHVVDGVEAREEFTEERLDQLEGLLIGYSGRAMVYRRLFDNVVHLGTQQITVYFGAVDNPAWYDPPKLGADHLDTLTAIDTARSGARAPLKNRIDLSLRWLAYAARDRGVDAFLKYWVAIETLSMPDTNVRPANKLLASAYGLLLDDAAQRFCLGRIQGVRGAIVHQGSRIEIPGEVAKYLEALYFDLLSTVIGTPCTRRALPLLSQGTFRISSWVTQAMKS